MNRRRFLATSAGLVGAVGLGFPAIARAGSATVAVLYFENGNPSDARLEPLKVGLAQMMITDLTGQKGLKVVERARLQAILDELEMGHSGVADPNTANTLGKLLSAQYLVTGSYMEMMGTFRVDARLIKVETSEIINSVGRTGKAEDFMRMESELVAELWSTLRARIGADTPAGPTGALEPSLNPANPNAHAPLEHAALDPTRGHANPMEGRPPDPMGTAALVATNPQAVDAALDFSQGLIALDKKELPRARESFEAALAKAPDFEDAQAALAGMEI